MENTFGKLLFFLDKILPLKKNVPQAGSTTKAEIRHPAGQNNYV